MRRAGTWYLVYLANANAHAYVPARAMNKDNKIIINNTSRPALLLVLLDDRNLAKHLKWFDIDFTTEYEQTGNTVNAANELEKYKKNPELMTIELRQFE